MARQTHGHQGDPETPHAPDRAQALLHGPPVVGYLPGRPTASARSSGAHREGLPPPQAPARHGGLRPRT
eukprot:983719-Lingulodinium_polyedra.AAC.1